MKDETTFAKGMDVVLEQQRQRRAMELEASEAYLAKHPFNPRRELSEDSKYIVRHLWLTIIVLPILFGVVLAVLRHLQS